MDDAMRKELETLTALQTQDTLLRTLQERLERFQAQERSLLETLAEEERSFQEEQRKLEDLRRLSRERAAAADDLDVQIRKYEKQLDEGLVSFKEMEALREMVQHSRQRMEELEDEALELFDRVEAEEATLEKRAATYEKWKRRIEEELAELRREMEAQRAKLEEAQGERRRLAQGVEPALLEHYERLLRDYENPVVPVRGGRCAGCSLQLSEITLERVREGREIVTCESCMRILYAV
jgi:predicted  nucleic acid-binding Zn-ribbon protein